MSETINDSSLTTQQSLENFERVKELYLKIRQLKEAINANKIHYYRPIGRQGHFHAASTTEVRVVLGGNRSGKTTCGAVEALSHALGYRPWLNVDHPDYLVRLADGDPIPTPNVGRIICENFEVNVVQTIHPKIMEWAPAGFITHVQCNQRGVPVRYDCSNGSVIHVLSYDQDDRAFEGPNGHWAWFDEPPPQRKFNGIRRGLIDFNGHCWITMTPLAEPWINDVLVNKANDHDGRIRMFQYSVWDNCIENGGTLSRRAIQSYLDDLPEDERMAREEGRFLHLAGLVFSEWMPEEPFYVEPFNIPASWPRVCVIDPHPRKPIAVLWAAVSPDDIIYVYRTLFSPKLRTVYEVSQAIYELEGWEPGDTLSLFDEVPVWNRGRNTENVVLRIIDTSANTPEKTSGETVSEQFCNYGLYCTDAVKRNKDAGINKIHEALRVNFQWGVPGLVVFNTCSEVKQNFMNFIWDRWGSSRTQGLKGEKQEPIKNNDDFIDCIRYIFQMRVTYRMLQSDAFRGSKAQSQDDETPRERARRRSFVAPRRPNG